MEKQDLNASKYNLQLYKSYAHTLSIIVIILVIFPLCIGFGRNHSYIAVASKSLFTGFAYWMLTASLQSLGKTGVFSPFTASFLPIVIFLLLSATHLQTGTFALVSLYRNNFKFDFTPILS